MNVEGSKAPRYTCKDVAAAGFMTSEIARAGQRLRAASRRSNEAKLVAFVEGTKAVGCSGLKGADITCGKSKTRGFSDHTDGLHVQKCERKSRAEAKQARHTRARVRPTACARRRKICTKSHPLK